MERLLKQPKEGVLSEAVGREKEGGRDEGEDGLFQMRYGWKMTVEGKHKAEDDSCS